MTAEEIQVILAEVAAKRGGPPHRVRSDNGPEFESQVQAQAIGLLWKEEYNTERPHSSLGYQTSAEFAAVCERYVPIEETPIEPPDEQPCP